VLTDETASEDMTEEVIQPVDFPNPAKHEKHAADAQVQLALLIIMGLAILYIIFARIDDWLKYRR
jgi:lysozyme